MKLNGRMVQLTYRQRVNWIMDQSFNYVAYILDIKRETFKSKNRSDFCKQVCKRFCKPEYFFL